MARQRQHRSVWGELDELRQQVDAFAVGQLIVQQDSVDSLALHQRQRLRGRGRLEHVVAVGMEPLGQRLPDQALVVDDEDGRCAHQDTFGRARATTEAMLPRTNGLWMKAKAPPAIARATTSGVALAESSTIGGWHRSRHELRQEIETIAVGEQEIQQNEVDAASQHQQARCGDGRGLCDEVADGLKRTAQRPSNQVLIIDDENPVWPVDRFD